MAEYAGLQTGVLQEGVIQWGDEHQRRNPLRWYLVVWDSFVCFEGSIMWKQAAKSELKNVDSTQTFELQNWFFFGADFTILENVTI